MVRLGDDITPTVNMSTLATESAARAPALEQRAPGARGTSGLTKLAMRGIVRGTLPLVGHPCCPTESAEPAPLVEGESPPSRVAGPIRRKKEDLRHETGDRLRGPLRYCALGVTSSAGAAAAGLPEPRQGRGLDAPFMWRTADGVQGGRTSHPGARSRRLPRKPSLPCRVGGSRLSSPPPIYARAAESIADEDRPGDRVWRCRRRCRLSIGPRVRQCRVSSVSRPSRLRSTLTSMPGREGPCVGPRRLGNLLGELRRYSAGSGFLGLPSVHCAGRSSAKGPLLRIRPTGRASVPCHSTRLWRTPRDPGPRRYPGTSGSPMIGQTLSPRWRGCGGAEFDIVQYEDNGYTTEAPARAPRTSSCGPRCSCSQ